MAGLYAILGRCDAGRLDSVSARLRYSDEAERRLVGDFNYVWLAFDDPHRFAPAHDPNSGVHVVVAGRTVWSPQDWQRAERLPFEGGLGARLLLDRYLAGGAKAVARYNGAATVIVWDQKRSKVHLWTDQFGYHPTYLYQREQDRPEVITTFADAIQCDEELDSTLDELSIVEFLRAWRATPPNTYYKYVKYAGAATHVECDLALSKVTRSQYWQPFQSEFYSTCGEAAEDLSAALRNAVSERTAAAKKVTLFISGGSDSRVMLFGADDPSKITGINLYETTPTRESNVAKALCERAGAKYIGVARDNDYYPRMLKDNVRWSGAMWCCEDNHYLGVKNDVDSTIPDLVMTACTTDWLFKGYGLERTYRKLFGKCLPLKRLIPDRVDGFLPNYPREAPSRFAEAVDARMSQWFSGCPSVLQNDLDYLLVEDRRIRPTSYTVSVSGQIMYRVYPYDTFLADSRVAECYSKIPAKMKLNGEVWGQAAGLVCQHARDIVDANNGWQVDSTAMAKLMYFGSGWLKRRLAKLAPKRPQGATSDNHPTCSASWPDFGWYIEKSPTIATLWRNVPESDREYISELWGSDPWEPPLSQWKSDPFGYFRILTILQFLQGRAAECSLV